MHTRNIKPKDSDLFSQIVKFTIPLLLTNLLQRLYIILDNLIAGNFAGEMTLAAVGATGHLTTLIMDMLIGISIGVSTVVAQMEGEKNSQSIHKAVHTSMTMSLFLGVGFGMLGVIFCKPLLMAMGTPSGILSASTTYMQVYFSGLLFHSVYNFGAAILRAKGQTKKPLIYLFIGGGVKVVLNFIFVAIFRWGVAAIAATTLVSQMISSFLVVRDLLKMDDAYRMNFRELKFYKTETVRILRTGIPIGMQACILSVSNVVLQSSINSFGELSVAGATAANTFNSIYYGALTTMSQTATIFCGRFFGAGKNKSLLKSMLWCCVLVLVVGGVFAVTNYPLAETLVGFFVEEPESISAGVEIVKVICATYALSGLMEVVCGGLRAINKATYGMVSTVIGLCSVRLGWIYTYFAAHRSLGVLYYSYPLSWAATLLLNTVLFVCIFRKYRSDKTHWG